MSTKKNSIHFSLNTNGKIGAFRFYINHIIIMLLVTTVYMIEKYIKIQNILESL